MEFQYQTDKYGLFTVSEQGISRFFFEQSFSSQGLVVKKYFSDVEAAFYTAGYLRERKILEAYSYEELEELSSTEGLRALKDVIKDLETQMNRFTQREWKRVARLFYEMVRYNVRGNAQDLASHHYLTEYKNLWLLIQQLKDGKYNENSQFKSRGYASISTMGNRLTEDMLYLLWRLDGGE